MARPIDADSASTYDAILVAAADVLDEVEQPSELSMRRVARAARVSIGTLQYYFPSREALLEGCLDEYHRRLQLFAGELITRANAAELTGRALIEEAARSFFRFVRRERVLVQLRLVMTTTMGQLSPGRQRDLMGGVLRAASTALGPHCEVSDLDRRLTIQALAASVIRLALLSDTELLHLTDLQGAEGRAAVEQFIVNAARRLLRPSDG